MIRAPGEVRGFSYSTGKTSFENSVENLCVEADYYTFQRQREFAIHGEIEPDLCEFVRKLLAGDRKPRTLVAMLTPE